VLNLGRILKIFPQRNCPSSKIFLKRGKSLWGWCPQKIFLVKRGKIFKMGFFPKGLNFPTLKFLGWGKKFPPPKFPKGNCPNFKNF